MSGHSTRLSDDDKRFQFLVEMLPRGIQECDTNGVITFANEAHARLYGCSVDDLVGKRMWDLLAHDRDQENLQEYLALLAREQPIPAPFVSTGRTWNGRLIDVQVDWNYKRNEDGTLVGFVSILTDITEQRKTDEALRESRRFTNDIVETAHAIILVLDNQGRIVRLNPYMERLSGYSLDEVRGKDWFETFVPTRDRGRIRDLFEMAVGDNPTQGNVNPIVTKDGHERQIEWFDTTWRDDSGNILGLICVGHDITHHLETEATLRSREAWLESVLASLHDCAIVVYGPDGQIEALWGTSEQDERYGMRAADAVGHKVGDLLPPEQAEKILARIQRVITSGRKLLRDVKVTMPNGDFWQTLSLAPLKNEAGIVVGAVGFFHDITDRKHLEDSLRESDLRFHLVSEATRDFIWDWDRATGEVWRNEHFYESFGQKAAEEHSLDYWVGRIHPDDCERVTSFAMKAVEEGKAYWKQEYRLRLPDGSYAEMMDRAFAIRDWTGRTYRVVGAVQDITERKQTEQLLKEMNERLEVEVQRRTERLANSTRRLQGILDNIFGFVGLYTLDGVLIEANRAPLEAAGLSKDEVIGKPFWETYWWSYSSDVQEQLKLALARAANGESIRYDVPVRVRDGKLITIDVTFGPLYDSHGSVVQLVGFAVDITERKQAEEALRQSEERFRHHFMNDPVPIYLWQKKDDDFELQSYNDAADATTSGQVKHLVGGKLRELYEDMPDVIENFAVCFSEQRSVRRTMLYRYRTNGQERHLDVTYVFVPPDYIMVHTDDISDRIRSEQLLRESEQQLRLVTDNVPAWIAYIDADECYRFVNKPYSQTLGIPAEGFIGQTVSNVVGPEIYKTAMPYIARALAGEELSFEEEFELPDGEVRWISGRHVPQKLPTGEVIGFFSLVTDITERKHAERMQQKLQLKLAHVDRLSTLELVTSSLAHELNQPLSAISNFCFAGEKALASPQPPELEIIRDLFNKSKTQAIRAGEIFQRLKALADKKTPDFLLRVDLLLLIQDVLGLFELEFEQNGIEVVVNIPPEHCWVSVDDIEIQQVFVNLIRNAIESMNGTTEETRRLTFTCSRSADDRVEICISDTGAGIETEAIESVFEPFFTTKTKGAGMGLSICRTIIELHEGQIWITPNPEQGATVHFTLPLAAE